MNRKKGIKLMEREEYKYTKVKSFIDNKLKDYNMLSCQLDCTLQHAYYLAKQYKQHGKEAFMHKNRNRLSSKKTSEEKVNRVIEIFKLEEHYNVNYNHFTEILEEYGVKLSYPTVRKILMEHNCYSPMIQKKTKKLIKQQGKTTSIKPYLVDKEDAHGRKARPKYEGELIEMDASQHHWLGEDKDKIYLHAAIDGASGKIVGAYFDTQETLKAYYIISKQMILDYGIPVRILTDKRTVFYSSTEKRNKEITRTNYGVFCDSLLIKLETTSVPEQKGRIERLFKTLQSRLIVTMRKHGVKTIEDANKFLPKFVELFNSSKFIYSTNYTTKAYEKLQDKYRIDDFLATYEYRIVDEGHTIKYKDDYYCFYNTHNNKVFPARKIQCIVINTIDDRTFGLIGEEQYKLVKCEKQQKISKDIDTEKPEKQKYIPPLSHPYRQASYDRMVKRKRAYFAALNT